MLGCVYSPLLNEDHTSYSLHTFCHHSQLSELAASKGIPVVISHVTSAFTQAASKSLGFEVVEEIEYKDYKVDGKAIFDMEGRPHVKVQLVAKKVL